LHAGVERAFSGVTAILESSLAFTDMLLFPANLEHQPLLIMISQVVCLGLFSLHK
jgi:hypothetical protein